MAESHAYYILAQAIRGPNGKPNHKVAVSPSKVEDSTCEERKLLGRGVTELLEGGGELLVSDNPRVESKARELARRVLEKWMRERGQRASVPREDGQVVRIVVEKTSVRDCRSVGAEHVVLSSYRLLGLDDCLKDLGFSERQRQVAALAIVRWAMNTGSERSTIRWAQRESALGELLGADFTALSPKTVYQIADRLL